MLKKQHKVMIDSFTLQECKRNKEVLELKIKSLEFAIAQSEAMINESKLSIDALTFLRRQKSESQQDLEVLYLIKNSKSL